MYCTTCSLSPRDTRHMCGHVMLPLLHHASQAKECSFARKAYPMRRQEPKHPNYLANLAWQAAKTTTSSRRRVNPRHPGDHIPTPTPTTKRWSEPGGWVHAITPRRALRRRPSCGASVYPPRAATTRDHGAAPPAGNHHHDPQTVSRSGRPPPSLAPLLVTTATVMITTHHRGAADVQRPPLALAYVQDVHRQRPWWTSSVSVTTLRTMPFRKSLSTLSTSSKVRLTPPRRTSRGGGPPGRTWHDMLPRHVQRSGTMPMQPTKALLRRSAASAARRRSRQPSQPLARSTRLGTLPDTRRCPLPNPFSPIPNNKIPRKLPPLLPTHPTGEPPPSQPLGCGRRYTHQVRIKQFDKLLVHQPHLGARKPAVLLKHTCQVPPLQFAEAPHHRPGAVAPRVAHDQQRRPLRVEQHVQGSEDDIL